MTPASYWTDSAAFSFMGTELSVGVEAVGKRCSADQEVCDRHLTVSIHVQDRISSSLSEQGRAERNDRWDYRYLRILSDGFVLMVGCHRE